MSVYLAHILFVAADSIPRHRPFLFNMYYVSILSLVFATRCRKLLHLSYDSANASANASAN